MLEILLYKNSHERMLVTTADSLSQSMDRAVKHYSSLFTLPPYPKLLLLLALICISGGLASTAILFPSSEGLVNGLFLGVSLFFVNLVVDYAVSMVILRRDLIYGLKRTTALSLFCWVLWFFFIFVGVAFGLRWGIRLCLLGFSAAMILRLIVLFSSSSKSYKRLLAASLLQPFSCIIPFLAFWAITDYTVTSLMLFFIFSLAISLISSLLFISVLNRVGMQTLGIKSIPLFKAFLLNWITDLNGPFEEFLEKLGENQDVEVSLIKFSSSKPKAAIVVPSIHPGPFKNIGSSFLPSMLKTALEKEHNWVVCVPHGLLGHEFDLASQIQNQKIIDRVVEFAKFEVSEVEATPFIKVSNGLATACCQVFGNLVFLSFSLAPKTTEDLPQELGLFVRQEAEKLGLACCVVVNAHNSIDGTINMQEALEALKTVATMCLKKAVSLRRLAFEVGAATVIPKEFGLREGMGPSGITVVVVKVGKQKTAYIVIDGNNMVSGLRENILSTLRSAGIDEGEVFTTDTHSVNAVVLNERGYRPVGEAMDHEKLIAYIKEAILSSLSNLEPVKAACRRITIPNVKVIGGKRLETLCLLIDRTLKKAKKVAIPIFATSGLLLMLVLMFV
jgi:putative membrane protein